MNDQEIVQTAMIVLPVFGIVLLGLTLYILPKISGWSRLEVLYPDEPTEKAAESLNWQALYIGKGDSERLGLSYRGCVILEPCSSGLRIRIWKLVAPFSSPIFLPWGDIEARKATVLGIRVCAMYLGDDKTWKLSIIRRIAKRIADRSSGALSLPDDLQ